jgi:Zn finger protein HypA/HybF involved in hydrogenase expression
MHEMSLLRSLLKQIREIRDKNGGGRVKVVRLKVGPLAHIEPEHLRNHFIESVQGTSLENTRLEIEETKDLHELTLESVDIEG